MPLMLSAQSLTCIRGERQLFSDISFALESGQCLFVRGENGSGKTSLLRILAGLLSSDEGQVLWQNQPINKSDEYYQELLYLGHSPAIKSDLSAIENINTQAQIDGITLNHQLIMSALKNLGLDGRENLSTRNLSAGQKRRVLLSRLITDPKKLWVLDEPFTALDVGAIEFLQTLMLAHLKNQGMIIVTSHQHLELSGVSTKEITL